MILDTNVIAVADGRADHAPSTCTSRCLQTLEAATRELVALDNGDQIINEYQRNVGGGYPFGVGYRFVLDLFNNRFNPLRCESVSITPHPERQWVEFPDDPDLQAFDPADRKFVAVAIASPLQHPIMNAVDSDWAAVDHVLRRFGVDVTYLFPDVTAPSE